MVVRLCGVRCFSSCHCLQPSRWSSRRIVANHVDSHFYIQKSLYSQTSGSTRNTFSSSANLTEDRLNELNQLSHADDFCSNHHQRASEQFSFQRVSLPSSVRDLADKCRTRMIGVGEEEKEEVVEGGAENHHNSDSSRSNNGFSCWWKVKAKPLLVEYVHTLRELSCTENNGKDFMAEKYESNIDGHHELLTTHVNVSREERRTLWISLGFRVKQEILGPLRLALQRIPNPTPEEEEEKAALRHSSALLRDEQEARQPKGKHADKSATATILHHGFSLRVVPDDQEAQSKDIMWKQCPNTKLQTCSSSSSSSPQYLEDANPLMVSFGSSTPSDDVGSSALFSRQELAILLTLYHHVECEDGVLLLQLLHQLRLVFADERCRLSNASSSSSDAAVMSVDPEVVHGDDSDADGRTPSVTSVGTPSRTKKRSTSLQMDSISNGLRDQAMARKQEENGSIAQLLFLLSSLKVAPEDVLLSCLCIPTHPPQKGSTPSCGNGEKSAWSTTRSRQVKGSVDDQSNGTTELSVTRDDELGSLPGLLYVELPQYSVSSVLLLGVSLHRFGFHEDLAFKRTIQQFQRLLWNRASDIGPFHRMMRRLRKKYDKAVVKQHTRQKKNTRRNDFSPAKNPWEAADDGPEPAMCILSNLKYSAHSLKLLNLEGHLEIDIAQLPLEFSLFPLLLEWLDALALSPFRRVGCVECVSDLLTVGALKWCWQQQQQKKHSQIFSTPSLKKSAAEQSSIKSRESIQLQPSSNLQLSLSSATRGSITNSPEEGKAPCNPLSLSSVVVPLWPLLARNTTWWLEAVEKTKNSLSTNSGRPGGRGGGKMIKGSESKQEEAHLLSQVLWTAVQRTEQMGLPQPFLAAALQQSLALSGKGVVWEKDECGGEASEDVSRLAMYDHVTADLIKVNRAN